MLSSLLEGSIEDALRRSESVSLEEIRLLAEAQTPALPVYQLLEPSEQIKIIAEIKRASPSRGDIATISDPVALAKDYERGGASAISVLTEERKFKGSLDDLKRVKASVNIPVLRKDFIGIPYQVYEARAAGADLILLIIACLDDAMLKELYELAHSLGMGVLVEAHDEEEIRRATVLGAKLVGINVRNLKTFEMDRSLYPKLADLLPEAAIKVAESGVLTAEDLAEYRRSGADLALIGEGLVTGNDPAATLQEFLKVSR
ncbi:MAG: indole-3-glycerol phosphate synthase TrpC [Microbacteriaceae bacterium]